MLNFEDLFKFELSVGAHRSPQTGLCAMEAVAWLEGEPHTDSPRCVDPVISMFVLEINDRANSQDRQRLIPYLPRLVGTAETNNGSELRAFYRRLQPLLECQRLDHVYTCSCFDMDAALKILDQLLELAGASSGFSKPVEERVRVYAELVKSR